MSRTVRPHMRPEAGDARLLHDLAVLTRALDGGRVPAERRLERALGADLLRALRSSIAATTARAA